MIRAYFRLLFGLHVIVTLVGAFMGTGQNSVNPDHAVIGDINPIFRRGDGCAGKSNGSNLFVWTMLRMESELIICFEWVRRIVSSINSSDRSVMNTTNPVRTGQGQFRA